MRNLILVLFLATVSVSQIWAALPALEREVNVRVVNESVGAVLNHISRQSGVQFSYNPAKIQVEKSVSLAMIKKPIRLVLNTLFKNGVTYKQRGNYIILVAAPMRAKEEPEKKITLSGYVYDNQGNKLVYASVFDKRDQLSAVTNIYGYFSMEVPVTYLPMQVKVIKQQYSDTTVLIKSAQNSIDIVLVPLSTNSAKIAVVKSEEVAQPKPDSILVESKDTLMPKPDKKIWRLKDFWLSSKIKANLRNISDTMFTRVQLSFVPYISTNRLLSGNTINTISINVLAGYSQGVRKAEVGGLFNIDRGDVQYFQAAGLINAVGGQVKGAQFAGLLNINEHAITGAQFAGLINFTLDSVNGVQAAGLANFTKKIKGVQAAGLVNTCVNINGVQAAGLLNGCMRINGVQAAGLVNAAGTIKGWQYAGLLNVAGTVVGGQLSVFNYADSCHGIPVGFFSFVRKGYHKLELSGDEVTPVQLSFRTGVPTFHNIFQVGANFGLNGPDFFSVGYGLGGSTAGARWRLVGDVMTQALVRKKEWNNVPLLTSFFIGPEVSLGKKMSLSFGPAFRLFITYTNKANDLPLTSNVWAQQVVPYTFYDNTFPIGTRTQLWVGGKISLKFL